jgi:Ca2+ transporting ATPase
MLYFNIGEILTVDGLMVTGSEVRMDESALTGESDPIRKLPY